MLFAGDAERYRTSAGRDQNVLAVQDGSIDIDSVAADEACQAMERVDAPLGIAALLLLRYGMGERPHEDDHRGEYDVIGIGEPSGQAECAEHDGEDRGGAAERGDDRSDDAGREQPLRGHAVLPGGPVGRRSMDANIARPT